MAEWIEQFLTVNKYSRPGIKNSGVKGIVMHWTATPGASDENEVSFFDGADGGGSRYASAHLFVDRDSARLDIPLNEVAYHANDHACRVPSLMPNANFTAIGIEMCVEKDGTIHAETIARAAKVAAALCKQFNLNPATNIFRHYDVTGKNCPAPWVTNGALFEKFKKDVDAVLNPPVVTSTPASTTNGKYTVQNGDTLYGIATDNHMTVAQLKSLNGLTSDVIQPGQVLNVAKVATPAPKPVTPSKSIDDLAKEVIAGTLGNGDARKKALGAQYDAVQARVAELLNTKPVKTVHELALEVIKGTIGSGDARKKALGSQYDAVQAEVNRILSGK
jgi:N-acetylmuramoyl-L-alanine amidase